ncbi:Enoyl-CoA hydratase / 3-hydroxyacyl-CoA dehydrogenase / 3-hydroxybutyryl-CoA epimerase [hydrothermal vent metagenome]|uniref:enoyl-CoA hydratase n=1 Tax=hydrothermal vent metagenome TaxID=652676 RepID=A0A3B1BRV1_9ZZZZ
MMDEDSFKNWSMEADDDNVVWLGFDKADSAANVLSHDALDELDDIIKGLSLEKPRGLIIFSEKKSGFIAGADVNEFTKLKDGDKALELIQRGQGIMDRVEALDFPTVAMIHGFALGGGLELALACRYRVASDDEKTKLGLPEVMLGIHPGFGGSVRLTRLIGGLPAMDMMLTGRSISARSAKKTGLVDHAVPYRHLKIAAKNMVIKKPPVFKPSLLKKVTNHSFVRPLLCRVMTKKVAKRARKEHYPAPYALIELWRDHFDNKKKMLAEEARSVSHLITGSTAQNLVRVFFLQERLKSLGSETAFTPAHVHVVGAGVMGGDIASWIALSGFSVSLQDTEPARIATAMKRAHDLFKKKLKKPRLAQAAMDRLMPDIAGSGVGRADLVIEAIFENADAKKSLYKELEPKMKPDALLATNTSSIPLEILGEGLQNPQRLVGLHFFNPVAKMQLVEVVKGAMTGDESVSKAAAFVKAIRRLPLTVKSSPGFLVNRILMPYLMEAVLMESEGIPVEAIDRAALKFGMPMGPILLADTVGLDICLSVADILSKDMNIETPQNLKKLVDSGDLGRKTGKGFYQFVKGKPKPRRPAPKGYMAPVDISDRLIFRLLNESAACLREQVVEDADLLDAGIIFGTGFAPFRGGPSRYAKDTGMEELKNRFEEFQQKYGPRFAPDKGWMEL